jgi:hypothetical protein
MRVMRWTVWMCALSAGITLSAAHGASVTITGTDGLAATVKPPTQAAPGAPGLPGGDGTDAVATALDPDPVNSATATGGNGGAGGPGGDVDPNLPSMYPYPIGGPGGAGGNGGSASARAETNVSTGDTSATAVAHGGSGGAGGPEGLPTASSIGLPPRGNGPSGVVGAGDARSSAVSLAGNATSLSQSTGGSSHATSSAESHGGTASSTAQGNGLGSVPNDVTATASAQADLEATAAATAGGVGATTANATSLSQTGGATANATAGSGYGASAPAESHASAVTHGSGDASASAIAHGGDAPAQDPPSFPPPAAGQATASADAVSDHGNATASVSATAGNGSPPNVPITVSGNVTGGSAGGDMALVDAVHGSAAGKLTLSQEAIGGVGGAVRGGNAQSDLHAANPGGGDLFAESIARGGATVTIGPPTQFAAQGGNAIANVVATDTHGASVEAHTTAIAGTGQAPFFLGPSYGSANAHAAAQGLGPMIARAESVTGTASAQGVLAEVLGSGPIARTAAQLTAVPFPNPYGNSYGVTAFGAEARLNTAAGSPLPASAGGVQALTVGAPSAQDVATWTQGSPHTQDALLNQNVLALGSTVTHTEGTLGSLEVDLDTASLSDDTRLGIAFFDPTSSGAFDLLHLELTVDGQVRFDQSFADQASALAALDDAVLALGALGAPQDTVRRVVLAFDLEGQAQNLPGIGFNFAVFAPEPAPAALLGAVLALALLLAVSRAASHSQRG